jgi:hypothetical protein
VIGVLASGCGGSGRYARYQDRGAALEATDAMLASIPQFPHAVLVQRTDDATTYRVGTTHEIDARPYGRRLFYRAPAGHTGAEVQRWFREELGSGHWSCTFHRRVPGVPYGFACRKRRQSVSASIGDDGRYELDASADTRVAPIRTVTVLGD